MRSLPFAPRQVKATERILDQIYAAAYAGLKGDNFATAVGLTPQAMSSLLELDPLAKEHELRGRADSELIHATKLAEASLNGDAKASLAILQHTHGWTAKQQVEVNGSVSMALDQVLEGAAKQLLDKMRVVEGECTTTQ